MATGRDVPRRDGDGRRYGTARAGQRHDAVAQVAATRGNRNVARIMLVLTIIAAFGFLGLEWGDWSSANFRIDDSAYGTIYYVLTGTHFAHVLGRGRPARGGRDLLAGPGIYARASRRRRSGRVLLALRVRRLAGALRDDLPGAMRVAIFLVLTIAGALGATAARRPARRRHCWARRSSLRSWVWRARPVRRPSRFTRPTICVSRANRTVRPRRGRCRTTGSAGPRSGGCGWRRSLRSACWVWCR